MITRSVEAPRFWRLDAAALKRWPLPGIEDGADKEQRGSVLIVAGSREIPGAALLGALAAARAGAGKLLIAAPQSAAHGIALAMPEARVIGLQENSDGSPAASAARQLAHFTGKVHTVLIGPGLPQGDATTAFVLGLLPHFNDVPVILDAAAMDAVMHAGAFSQPVLLTPHCGEMAHLTGHDKPLPTTPTRRHCTTPPSGARYWPSRAPPAGSHSPTAACGGMRAATRDWRPPDRATCWPV